MEEYIMYLPAKLNGFGCKCDKAAPDEFSLRSGSEPVRLSLTSDRSDSISDLWSTSKFSSASWTLRFMQSEQQTDCGPLKVN